MNSYAGIYSLPESSRYLYITAPQRPPHYTTVRRWVRGEFFQPERDYAGSADVYLSFEELVSLRMIVALRIAGFSLQHVRKVHRWLKDLTGYPRPFALQDLWISTTEVFVEMEGYIMEEGLLSASRQGQYTMDFVKGWLKRLRRPRFASDSFSLDIAFNPVEGRQVASEWTTYPYVVLNPLVQFGAPCLEGTRIPTRTVASMYAGGDAPQAIAQGYGVPILKVESAMEWEDRVAAIGS